MTITLNGDSGISTPMYNGSITANPVTPSVNMKNRIINGAMVIDQRNAGASVTIGATGQTYTLDRWYAQSVNASKFSIQQNAGSVTPPAGFTNYLGVTSLAATSSASTDYYALIQAIEGFNFADLNWGSANAKTVTLSFQVYSSLTGTFSGSLTNSAGNRSYPFSYTISSANTWTNASVTINGDTSGTWVGATNGVGVFVRFDLGMGSNYRTTANSWQTGNYYGVTGATSVVGTNGATFYITGVQLEVGSTSSSYDYRQYGTELALCQRYYETSAIGIPTDTNGGFTGMVYVSGTQAIGTCNFKVTKRATPTVTLYSGSGGAGAVLQNGVADNIAATAAQISGGGFTFANRTSGSFTSSYGYPVTAGYTASAEL